MVVVCDSNVIFDFLAIRRIDLLVRLFGCIHIVSRVDGEIKRNRIIFEQWRDSFQIFYLSIEQEKEINTLRRRYGRKVSDADRSSAIVAREAGNILLTRDKNLIKEAKEALGMIDEDFIDTVEILRMCVEKGLLSKRESLLLCEDISSKRCRNNPFDKTILEELPD